MLQSLRQLDPNYTEQVVFLLPRYKHLVFKLKASACLDIERASPIAATLLLVFFFSEALPLRYYQISVCLLAVSMGHVCI
jgi:hypothetical protein